MTNTSTAVVDRPGRIYRAARLLLDPLVQFLWPTRVEGFEHVARHGPGIVAANHLSFFDSVALTVAVRRRLGFVGKAEYLDNWKTRRLFPALGMIPLERGGRRQALRALAEAEKVIESGELFAIYPEGTRSRDGRLHKGHRGVGRLAVATGAPVIPAGITGTDKVQPPGTRVPRPFRRIVVRFGPPIDPADFGRSGILERRRRITDAVMSAIQGLTGQELATAPSM